jgi:hypothetical protein
MPTLTSPSPHVKPRTRPARPADTCSLQVVIRGTCYRIRRLLGEGIARGYRLTKPDGQAHDVHHDDRGEHCTCGDFTFRREGIDPKGCKHIRALRAWGLL